MASPIFRESRVLTLDPVLILNLAAEISVFRMRVPRYRRYLQSESCTFTARQRRCLNRAASDC